MVLDKVDAGMKMATSSQDPIKDTAFKDGTGYNVRDDNTVNGID